MILNPAIKTRSANSVLGNYPADNDFAIADSNSIINLKKGNAEIRRVADASIEVLGLFERIADSQVLMSNMDFHSKKLLTNQFLDDFIDFPEEVTQLKLIYFKFIESMVKESHTFPQQLVNSHILTQGELQICKELIQLKEAVNQRQQYLKEAQAANVNSTSMIAMKANEEVIERALHSLRHKAHDLSSDFLEEILPLLTKINRLDTYLELLINRLQFLDAKKVKVQERIDNSKKMLTKREQESAAESTKHEEWFHFSSAEKENLEKSEQELNKVESESKRIFTQIFSILYEVSGVEKRVVEVVELPSFLRRSKWISWLWDKIYCNKKVIITKNNVFKFNQGSNHSTIIHDYMANSNCDSRSLLVSLLKKIFSSSIESLRKSSMIWLMNEGRVALVDEIDPNLSDQTLTSALCQIVQSEGILQGQQALENQRYLIDNLVKRKQTPAALKLIQGLLDNCLLTAQHHPTMVDLSNALLSDDASQSLFHLSTDRLSSISASISDLPVISVKDRLEYVDTAFAVMRDAGGDVIADKYRLIQYFEDKRRACHFQLDMLREIQSIDHKLEKVAKVVDAAGSTESGVAEVALVDVNAFRTTDCQRIKSNLILKAKQVELITKLLNVKLWDCDTLLTRIADPLSMHKFIAISSLNNSSVNKSTKLNVLINCIRSIIGNSSNLQTLFDVIYLADTQPKKLEVSIDYSAQLQKPVCRNLLEELWRSDVIWPNNAKNELTVIFKELGQKDHMDGMHPEELLIAFMNPAEQANLHNPFMSLLLSNASQYLDCNLAGAVNVNREKPEAASYLFLLSRFSPFWTGDFMASTSRAVFKRFGPSLSTCYSMLQNIQTQQYAVAEKEKTQGLSDDLEQKKDELDTLTFRLIIIYSKVVVEFAEQCNASDKSAEKEFAHCREKISRTFNEMISRINNSVILSPTLKKLAKHHVLKGRHQVDLIDEKIKKTA